MADLKRMINDCFWDLDITDKDILEVLKSNDRKKKAFLFEKILLNSTKLFDDLKIFDLNELRQLLEEYQVPNFNSEFAFRRKNLVEVYFFKKPLLIEDLKWTA